MYPVESRKPIKLFALIDSGARRTLIEKGLASALGFKLKDLEETDVSGIGGENKGWKANINLGFKDFSKKTYISEVVFTKMLTVDMILGEEGFFQNFQVLFEGGEKFKLNPISRL